MVLKGWGGSMGSAQVLSSLAIKPFRRSVISRIYSFPALEDPTKDKGLLR